MILRPGYLPGMYVIALLPFAALIVAGSAQALWGLARGRHPKPKPPASGAGWRTLGYRAAVLVRSV
jgi:hypothetical protein